VFLESTLCYCDALRAGDSSGPLFKPSSRALRSALVLMGDVMAKMGPTGSGAKCGISIFSMRQANATAYSTIRQSRISDVFGTPCAGSSARHNRLFMPELLAHGRGTVNSYSRPWPDTGPPTYPPTWGVREPHDPPGA